MAMGVGQGEEAQHIARGTIRAREDVTRGDTKPQGIHMPPSLQGHRDASFAAR
jgi:hypothetical protein